MPVEFVELIQLIGGLILLTIPGYLWSFIIFHTITTLERIMVGFVLGLCVLSCGMFLLDVGCNLRFSSTIIWLLFAAYSIPALIYYGLVLYKNGYKKPDFKELKNKKFLLLIIILGFTAFMVFLPHLKEWYFLPLHVDEWEHWCYSNAVEQFGSASFIHPYLGTGILQPFEIGFNLITSGISWISGSSYVTIFVFMPSLLAVFMSLAAFNIGERAERKFGLEAAFLISFLPTTCRMMGPSFYVPLAMGLLFILLIIWVFQQETYRGVLIAPFFLWCLILIHPPTAFAGYVVSVILTIMLLLKRKLKLFLFAAATSLIPLCVMIFFSMRWNIFIQDILQSFLGNSRFSNEGLSMIQISFEHLGIVIWVLFFIGAYYSFAKEKTTTRAIVLCAIAFGTIIALYNRFNYGIPIIQERSFMYLYLMVALVAGLGISEVRRMAAQYLEKRKTGAHGNIFRHTNIITALAIVLLLIGTEVPVHFNTPFYHMIDEKEYDTFSWIHDNIKSFEDKNQTSIRSAVDPFKASPFCAVSGLYVVSSSMSPLYGYGNAKKVTSFLSNCCIDEGFLKNFTISVVYTTSCCNNENLTEVYPNVYIYPKQ